jgi:hypothetical protein
MSEENENYQKFDESNLNDEVKTSNSDSNELKTDENAILEKESIIDNNHETEDENSIESEEKVNLIPKIDQTISEEKNEIEKDEKNTNGTEVVNSIVNNSFDKNEENSNDFQNNTNDVQINNDSHNETTINSINTQTNFESQNETTNDSKNIQNETTNGSNLETSTETKNTQNESTNDTKNSQNERHQLIQDLFKSTSEVIKGEMQVGLNDLVLLEKINEIVGKRYKDMKQKSEAIKLLVEKIKEESNFTFIII